jgi:hypothetical protein
LLLGLCILASLFRRPADANIQDTPPDTKEE